jgi:hypothetical protein
MQVGHGKINWKDCAEHARLREKVMNDWPKVNYCFLIHDTCISHLLVLVLAFASWVLGAG